MRVGDRITCSARGNPSPVVTLSPGNQSSEGQGNASIVVREDWVGYLKEVTCQATNTYQGEVQSATAIKTFLVLRVVVLMCWSVSWTTKEGSDDLGVW